MCKVSVTEFRRHLFHYIERCSVENVLITRRGKVIAVLSNPDKQYYKTLENLCGCIKADLGDKSYDDLIGEAILEKQKQVLWVQRLVMEATDASETGEKDYSLEESKALIEKMISGE